MNASPRSVERTALAHRLWRIGAARVSTGNRVALLRNGPATFDAMLALIAGARERVSLESYIVRSDAVGERFAPALIDAARRGVRTRVVFDWIGHFNPLGRAITFELDAMIEDDGLGEATNAMFEEDIARSRLMTGSP